MNLQPAQESQIPFKIPSISKPCFTSYKIYGTLHASTTPLVVLHGGPGGGHDYLLPFAALSSTHNLPVIFYDQIGCGASTHLPETAGDESFWTVELFVAELANLLDHFGLRAGPAGYHLLGQSWGGMLAADFAGRRPRGLRRLVLASALASRELNVRALRVLRAGLADGDRRVLDRAEETGEWEGEEVKRVTGMMSRRHVCRTVPVPEELLPAFRNLSEDRTVYSTMYGPHWLAPRGSLDTWTCIPGLSQIEAPTLVYKGEHDTSSDWATEPFFEHIPRVRWITFAGSGHMCHLEDGLRERVLSTVGDFLTQK